MQQVPLSISIAPFPEGFRGDLDETFQQAVQLMQASVQGNFLQGLILPPGSTLPTSDQGPIAMGNVWYFWDPVTGQYLPQTVALKVPKNYAKNCVYQISQAAASFTPGVGVTPVNDMSICRATEANVVAVAAATGPLAGPNNDYIPSAIKYTVGPNLVASPIATDLFSHEHLFEGSDIAMLQGQVLSCSFWVWVNQPGTYSAYLTSHGRDASYVVNFTVTTANVWLRVTMQGIPAFPATGTWAWGQGQTGLYFGVAMLVGTQWQTANLGSWQPAFFAGSSHNSNFCTVVNNQIMVTGVKLEASPVASYLAVPSFDADYWDCLRYYFTSFAYQSLTGGIPLVFSANSPTAAYGSLLFPRRMSKAPNVVPYSPNSNAAGNLYDVSSAADVAVATLPSTPKGTGGTVTIAGATKGDILTANFVADARLT